jgi:hypothetical protein
MSLMKDARRDYHGQLISKGVLGLRGGVPTNADVDSTTSRALAEGLAQAVVVETGLALQPTKLSGQTLGKVFADITRDFIEAAMKLLPPPGVGGWSYSVSGPITNYAQFAHLAEIEELVKAHAELQLDYGQDYIIAPDIVVSKLPVPDAAFGAGVIGGQGNGIASSTPIRSANQSRPLLHASVSCKWTMRSDRAQNVRTEALNLIRHRKGRLPMMVAITAEPLPSRLSSLAKGTGDIDRLYHFALYELMEAAHAFGNREQEAELRLLVDGKRLADASDLPFDLLI